MLLPTCRSTALPQLTTRVDGRHSSLHNNGSHGTVKSVNRLLGQKCVCSASFLLECYLAAGRRGGGSRGRLKSCTILILTVLDFVKCNYYLHRKSKQGVRAKVDDLCGIDQSIEGMNQAFTISTRNQPLAVHTCSLGAKKMLLSTACKCNRHCSQVFLVVSRSGSQGFKPSTANSRRMDNDKSGTCHSASSVFVYLGNGSQGGDLSTMDWEI